ncbi:hypothetical protein [Huintestinicola sp.]
MIRKLVSCLTALCIVSSISSAVYAHSEPKIPTATTLSNGIMPLYDNVNYVASGISINSNNKAVCTGSYYLYSKYKSVITMTLMKSTDKSNWSYVESWSQTNNVKNPAGYSRTSTNALSSSYYYCNYVEVKIYDSNDNVIETVSCFSNPCHL